MRHRTFTKLVEDYTGKSVASLELASDNTSTALRVFLTGRKSPIYFLCIDRPPIGPRRPLLTALELEEVEFASWPPTKVTTSGGHMLMSIG
jgi:hypothetical protein